MFNYLFHPYLRWLRDRSDSDGPDFNIDRGGSLSQNLAQPPVNFPIPESDVLLQSAPPTGPVNFVAEQPNELRGFRVGLRDAVPGFNLNENDPLPPETPWLDGLETPESSDTAQTLVLPPGVVEPGQPTPQLPEWLRNVLTMPVPRLSTAFDPQTGRRIVPYELLVNWARPNPSMGQNVRETAAASADATEDSELPVVTSVEAPAIQQSTSLVTPARLADPVPDYHSAMPQSRTARPVVEETSWTLPTYPLKSGQTHDQRSGVSPEYPRRTAEQQSRQQTPLPQEQQTRLSNGAGIAFGSDSASFRPTPSLEATPIQNSVYNPDVDPGFDALFDLVGIKENKIQGDAAKDAEVERIKKENRLAGLAQETRIHAAGAPDYMVSDIIFRRNGTSAILITEVKSGDGKLSPQQAAKLGEAARTGEIYITSEKAAKELGIKPYKTFAAQGIMPQVYISGGNQKEIARQLRNQGLEVIPQKVRPGQPPRLLVVRARPS
jgi:hypothetical protein